MKKIVELENRWKSYKYRLVAYYIFFFVLLVFLICFGLFIKLQYDKYSAKTSVVNNVRISKDIRDISVVRNEKIVTPVSRQKVVSRNTINFVCRKVVVDKLTVRASDSFSSKPLGYYSKDSVFCADSKISNGLLKTQNGWVGSSSKYSKDVNTNMFVDFGFNKYNIKPIVKTEMPKLASNLPADEIEVLEKKVTDKKDSKSSINDDVYVETTKSKVKPVINITSEVITPEKSIELLKYDFSKSNDYDTAMKIAVYYYDNKIYKDAIKWALNASKADSKDKQKADSWVIYSKSLYASGSKEEAIDVLEKYVSTTNSTYVRDILNNMRKGVI